MLVDFADAIGGNVYTLGGTFIKLFAFFFFSLHMPLAPTTSLLGNATDAAC